MRFHLFSPSGGITGVFETPHKPALEHAQSVGEIEGWSFFALVVIWFCFFFFLVFMDDSPFLVLVGFVTGLCG